MKITDLKPEDIYYCRKMHCGHCYDFKAEFIRLEKGKIIGKPICLNDKEISGWDKRFFDSEGNIRSVSKSCYVKNDDQCVWFECTESIPKLSETGKQIIEDMKNGWELGIHNGWHIWSCLQRGGIGKGGEVKKVSRVSIHALEKLGLIKVSSSDYSTTIYKLTEGASK